MSIGSIIHPLYICTPPYIHMPSILPIHLYVPPIPYVPHISWGLGGSMHPYVMGSFGGLSVHLSGISVSVSTSICLSVHNSHTSYSPSLWVASYWTGCPWMSAMLHAIVPFFVVFSLCLKLLLPQLQLLPLQLLLCAPVHHLSPHWLP